MALQSFIATALLVGTAFAFPAILTKKDTTCGGTDTAGNPYIAELGIYSDANCEESLNDICVYSYQGTVDSGSGAYSCNPGLLPGNAPFYAKVDDSSYSSLQLLFTRDQSCPPSGPGAVFATLGDNPSCVQFNLGGDAPGISVFPNGGAEIARVATRGAPIVQRQSTTECSGFVVDSQAPSTSQTVQVSNIIDCTNGAEAGCTISITEQQSQSVSTSYSLSAGGGIEGIFSVEATFGQEFTEESSTAIQNGFTVPAGQRGYIGSYSAATLFTGRFTGCSQGDSEQPGSTLAIKKNGFTYSIVLTGSRIAQNATLTSEE